ncbi:unnamed protein product, partial [Phaeothamnion confervicola]
LLQDGELIRTQLAGQLVEGIDQLGTDTVSYLQKNVGQLSAGGVPAILSGDRQALRKVLQDTEMTPAMASALRVTALLAESEGFDARRVLPLLRRLLREPEAQRLSIQMASSLSERAVSRVVRA